MSSMVYMVSPNMSSMDSMAMRINEHRDVLHHGQALRHVLHQGRVLRDDHDRALRQAHHRQAYHRQAHQGQAFRGDQALRIRDDHHNHAGGDCCDNNIEQNPYMLITENIMELDVSRFKRIFEINSSMEITLVGD